MLEVGDGRILLADDETPLTEDPVTSAGLLFRLDMAALAEAAASLPTPFPFPWNEGSKKPGQSAREDEIAIGTGGPILVAFSAEGDFITNYPNITTGWRGFAAMETGRSAVVMTTFTDLSVTGGPHGGAGMVAFVNDAESLAVSNWLNSLFGFFEQGLIELDAVDFCYAKIRDGEIVGGEMCFLTPLLPPEFLFPPDGELSVTRLYVAQNEAGRWVSWTALNGWVICGPVLLPPDLIGSTQHGIQLDVNPGADLIDFSQTPIIECHTYEDTAPDDYDPPTVVAGTMGSSSAATSITVPMPAGIDVHWRAYLILAGDQTPTTTGWTAASNVQSVTGMTGRVWYREVNDGDTWHLSSQVFSHASGSLVGQIVGVSNHNPYRGAASDLQQSADSTENTSTTVPEVFFAGPHRCSFGWVATVNSSTQTWPTGWDTTSGSRLTFGLIEDWSNPGGSLVMADTSGAGHTPTTGSQAVTLGTSSRAISFHIPFAPLVFRRDPDWPTRIPTRPSSNAPWND